MSCLAVRRTGVEWDDGAPGGEGLVYVGIRTYIKVTNWYRWDDELSGSEKFM
jgi:hypothetical protein